MYRQNEGIHYLACTARTLKPTNQQTNKTTPTTSKSSHLISFIESTKGIYSQVSSFLLLGIQLLYMVDLIYFYFKLYFMMFTSEITDNSILTFCEV